VKTTFSKRSRGGRGGGRDGGPKESNIGTSRRPVRGSLKESAKASSTGGNRTYDPETSTEKIPTPHLTGGSTKQRPGRKKTGDGIFCANQRSSSFFK